VDSQPPDHTDLTLPPRHVSRRRPLVSRRGLLLGGGLTGLGALAAAYAATRPDLPFLDDLPFLADAPVARDPMPTGCGAPDVSAAERQLIISNWPSYIDPPRKKTSTLQAFQRRSGITVDYTDDVNDNVEFYDAVHAQLQACQAIDRDLMMLTDWMAAKMIWLGWIQPLDAARVPNLHANLIKPLRDVPWDPDLTFHAPWQSGLTGIAYNAAVVGEVRTFTELLSREDLRGRVTLLTEMRDTMGFMLRLEGADPEAFTSDQWANAFERIEKVTRSGHLRGFTGNEYVKGLKSGDIVACEAWSGDVIQLQFDNPDIKFVVPEEGLSLWSDNMLVPNGATHKANAEDWVNYFYEPEVAAHLAAWVNYICPVKGAREEMEKIDPALVDNSLIFPDDEALADAFGFMTLSDEQEVAYGGAWETLVSS
jgi:spermidine/putrescine transport system substrate-binding protein